MRGEEGGRECYVKGVRPVEDESVDRKQVCKEDSFYTVDSGGLKETDVKINLEEGSYWKFPVSSVVILQKILI